MTTLNTLSLKLSRSTVEDYNIVDISIDDVPLTNYLYYQELACETSTTNMVGLAGCYEGLPSVIVLETSQHFFCNCIPEYRYEDDRIALMDYAQTGVPGDYTIACNMEMHPDVVIWNRFKNYSRLYDTSSWHYKLSFCFDRKQYDAAVGQMNRLIANAHA